jgi:flagellar biosynthesis/type III secretory pathway ATPase
VLTNTDGDLDPLADEIKSLLDGHLVLSSAEAERGIRPAIDYLASISRVEATVASDTQRSEARTVRRALARLRREKEMVGMGMTPDDELQRILACEPLMTAFLSNQLDLGALGRELGAISTGA